MKITIYAIGHLKEPYWRAAEAEYLKRLAPYAKTEIVEVDDLSIPAKASAAIEGEIREKEGERVLAKLKKNEFLCALDLNKDEPDSLSLARQVKAMIEKGGSSLSFAIGGSLGLGDNLKKRADASISLSRLTFTHQMTRIILLEQVYRSFKILAGEPYHK
jgi:23S rRNA (pseudouridine1915-N3)-methyltransferase